MTNSWGVPLGNQLSMCNYFHFIRSPYFPLVRPISLQIFGIFEVNNWGIPGYICNSQLCQYCSNKQSNFSSNYYSKSDMNKAKEDYDCSCWKNWLNQTLSKLKDGFHYILFHEHGQKKIASNNAHEAMALNETWWYQWPVDMAGHILADHQLLISTPAKPGYPCRSPPRWYCPCPAHRAHWACYAGHQRLANVHLIGGCAHRYSPSSTV